MKQKTILFGQFLLCLTLVLSGCTDKKKEQPIKNDTNVKEKEEIVDENYVNPWNDSLVTIHGIEFNFPMTYSEFEEKINQTPYKVENTEYLDEPKYYDLDGLPRYVTYDYQANKDTSGKDAFYYDISVFFQSPKKEKTVPKDCYVIGIEARNKTLNQKDVGKYKPYDDQISFTKDKLQLGQIATKKDIEKKYGKSNGWEKDNNKYSAGSLSTAYFKLSKFTYIIDEKDNSATLLYLVNPVKKD